MIATGESHTVRSFVTIAAGCLGFELEWTGTQEHERGIDRGTGRTIVQVNPDFYRPAEVELLVGNAARARTVLGWERKVGFEELVAMMAEADARRVRDGTPAT